MSTSTPYLGLTKPASTENFSRATYNNNLDLIDTAASGLDARVEKVQSGTCTVAVANATAAGSLTVTFPVAFASIPNVVLTKATVSGAASSMRKLQPVVTAVTATNFVANLETADGTNVGAAFNVVCQWIAVVP